MKTGHGLVHLCVQLRHVFLQASLGLYLIVFQCDSFSNKVSLLFFFYSGVVVCKR